MGLHVLLDTVVPGELLATQFTHVWLLPCVYAHVLIVVCPVVEALVAQLTLDFVPV